MSSPVESTRNICSRVGGIHGIRWESSPGECAASRTEASSTTPTHSGQVGSFGCYLQSVSINSLKCVEWMEDLQIPSAKDTFIQHKSLWYQTGFRKFHIRIPRSISMPTNKKKKGKEEDTP